MNAFPQALGAGIAAPAGAFQVADTVLAVPARDGFDIIFGVTAGLIGLTFLAVLLGVLFLFFQARKVARAIEDGRRRFARDRGIEHLRRTAENIEKISKTLREETERVRDAGSEVSDRISQASDRMEERIEEFNALIEVIQAEAEEIFLDSASTARGVRRGLGRLAGGRPTRRTQARRLARERLRSDLPGARKALREEPHPGHAETEDPDREPLPDSQVSAPPGDRPTPPREQAGAEEPRP